MKKVQEINALIRSVGLNSCFGSKSQYRDTVPDCDPVFNAYILSKDEHGLLQIVSSGQCDLELTDENTLKKLQLLCLQAKQDVFVYHESTVHNRTFNGHVFPYEDWRVKVSFRHGDVPFVDIKDR